MTYNFSIPGLMDMESPLRDRIKYRGTRVEFPDTVAYDSFFRTVEFDSMKPDGYDELVTVNADIVVGPRGGGEKIVVKKLSNSDNSISITDSAAWSFEVRNLDVSDIPPGFYVFDVECVDTSGKKVTVCRGSWRVIPDVTERKDVDDAEEEEETPE